MPEKNIEPKDNLTIALSASVVAREALQFLDPSSNAMLLKLKYKALMEQVDALRLHIKNAIGE